MFRNVHPRSRSWFFTHPGSRGQKGTGSRISDLDPQHWIPGWFLGAGADYEGDAQLAVPSQSPHLDLQHPGQWPSGPGCPAHEAGVLVLFDQYIICVLYSSLLKIDYTTFSGALQIHHTIFFIFLKFVLNFGRFLRKLNWYPFPGGSWRLLGKEFSFFFIRKKIKIT